jgi:hypothetical protein
MKSCEKDALRIRKISSAITARAIFGYQYRDGDVGRHGAGIMGQSHTDLCREASVTSRLIRRHPPTDFPWLGRNAHARCKVLQLL